MNDPYLTLGINEAVTDQDVAAAYHRKLKQYPPEQHPESFAKISEAYEMIRTKRNRLDLHLFGPIVPTTQLSELAANEEQEIASLKHEQWKQAALKQWLTREQG